MYIIFKAPPPSKNPNPAHSSAYVLQSSAPLLGSLLRLSSFHLHLSVCVGKMLDVLAAAAAVYLLASVWYSRNLFGTPWLRTRFGVSSGVVPQTYPSVTVDVLTLGCACASGAILRRLVVAGVIGSSSVGEGAVDAGLVCGGMVAACLAGVYARNNESLGLFFIDAAFSVASLALQAAILVALSLHPTTDPTH